MQKISVAIVGWGNVGRGCKRAIEESSDLVLAGVVRRPSTVSLEEIELQNTKVVSDIAKLKGVDVVLLCIPSREVPAKIAEYQKMGFSTVDSYDEHERIVAVRKEADITAKAKKVVSIIAAGWDPGTDSAIRGIMKVVSITGYTTTTFGGTAGGRSMGHTALVKAIPGVKNGIALTLANGRGKHKRKVYLELMPDADFGNIERAIQADPYFANDPLEIEVVKSVDKYNTLQHAGSIERTGMQVNQRYDVAGINPEFTANVMVSCARACMAAKAKGDYGCYTFIERPLIDYLPGNTLEEKLEGY